MLDGVRIAAEIKAEVAAEVDALRAEGVTPGLAVVLVGEVPASAIYVRSKVKTCGELGIYSEMLTPPETVTTDEMLQIIAELNAREEIDGILVQLPLPKHVDTKRLLEAVSPEKDVDGFHPVNAGRLQTGQPALAPCTPAGIMEILRRSSIAVAGREAVVVGRSDIVGKPAAMMAAERLGDGDGVSQPDGGPGGAHAGGGDPSGGDWARRVYHAGDGDAGSDADRRGHQSRHGAG